MSSRSEPSGSRKYTLVPSPSAPVRSTGPSSTATPPRRRVAEVRDRALDRPVPHEAQIAVAGGDAHARDRLGRGPGKVDVELLGAEAVGLAAAGQGADL